MFFRQSLPALLLAACGGLSTPAWGGDSYRLRDDCVGQVRQADVTLEVGGDLKFVQDRKVTPVKMNASAALKYHERVLAAGASGVSGSRSVRYYEEARTSIKIDKGTASQQLSDERRLIVADADRDSTGIKLFSPSGPLTREELDLIDAPGNTLAIAALLPQDEQAIGDKWEPAPDVLGAVLGLDAVSSTDVVSVLKSVEADIATVESTGHVDGAIGGVATEIELKIKCLIDVKNGHMTRFGLAIKEKRSIGHVSPGLDVVARVRIDFRRLESSPYLSPAALADVPVDPNPAVTMLEHKASAGSLAFYHDRRWYAVQNDAQTSVLRMVDRGELIAQCNVNRLDNSADGKPLAGDVFQQGVREALGEKFKQFVTAGNLAPEGELSIFQVIVKGEASGLPVQWNYYLVADKAGRQAIYTFTLESAWVDVFGDTDLALVRSTQIPTQDPSVEPTPANKVDVKAEKPDATTTQR